MDELNMIIPITDTFMMESVVPDVFDLIIEETSSLASTFEGRMMDLEVEEQITILPTRISKTYTSYRILPLFTRFYNEDGSDEVAFTKEVREWDMVLTSNNGNETPRRQPTELIYRAKKLKNPFPTE